MIKRPIHERFNRKILDGIKVTTIRGNAWPVSQDIMLYNWSGKPYRSKQRDVVVIRVRGFWTIQIQRTLDDQMIYKAGAALIPKIHETEGFDSVEEMDSWFRRLVKPGHMIEQSLMLFRVVRHVTSG